jgi:hypothetical protein
MPLSVGELPMSTAYFSMSANRRWYGTCSANFSATLGLIVLIRVPCLDLFV